MNLGFVAFSNVGMAKSCHYPLDIMMGTGFGSVRNRHRNPLGSTWRGQPKTVSKDIINITNEIKAQTNKCHTFPVLLFNHLSLCMQ